MKLLQRAVLGEGTEHEMRVKNRVFMAPLTRGRASEDHVPTKQMIKYYADRASAGLLIAEGTGISQTGMGWFCAPGLWTDEMVEAWKPVTEAVHQRGGKIYPQLWHLGRQSHSDVIKTTPVSASPVPLTAPVTGRNHEKKEPETPHALTIEEIAATVKDYGHAARNALKAGFDGVEIHSANGYLIDQFTQSASNKRSDRYGGSIENKLRFFTEVVDEIASVVPKERMGARLSPNGAFGEVGSEDNIDTFDAAVEMLAKKRIGYIHLMDGLSWGFHDKCEPYTAKRAREIIRRVQKDEGICTMLVVNVGYTKESAEQVLQEGLQEEPYVDQAVAFGRLFISNPDLVERFENDWPLAKEAPYVDWWGRTTEEGYNTYPSYDKEE